MQGEGVNARGSRGSCSTNSGPRQGRIPLSFRDGETNIVIQGVGQTDTRVTMQKGRDAARNAVPRLTHTKAYLNWLASDRWMRWHYGTGKSGR